MVKETLLIPKRNTFIVRSFSRALFHLEQPTTARRALQPTLHQLLVERRRP
jgi:hypothetical protein